jgi:gluconate 2-dehydrogenase gamma chain
MPAGRPYLRAMLDPLDRRAFLGASCVALASTWLAADPAELRASLAHAARARRRAAPDAFQVFTPEQADDVDAIAAQIVPTDDLPGAREAGAVYFIDHSLATWAAEQRESFVHGLADLNQEVHRRWPETARFASLASERQIDLLKAVEPSPFFQMARFATIAGTFANASWGGNRDKIGWRILGFEDRFVWAPPFGDYDAEASQ